MEAKAFKIGQELKITSVTDKGMSHLAGQVGSVDKHVDRYHLRLKLGDDVRAIVHVDQVTG